jgi:hypothetical protein
MSNQTELLAAETLLERGVKVQIVAPLLFRLIGIKTFTLTLRSPRFGTLLRSNSFYLQTGISIKDLEDLTVEKALKMFNDSGVLVSKAVACAIINSWTFGWLLTSTLAWLLRTGVHPKNIYAYMNLILIYGGVEHFTNTIRLVATMKVTSPNLSQAAQGS